MNNLLILYYKIQDIRTLQSLILSGNWLEIENIELILAKAPNLEKLDLDQAGVYTLPPGLFYNNQRIRKFNVSGNYLVNIEPSLISHLDYLEMLDLSSNYFMGLDQIFFDVIKQKSRLKMLYLQVSAKIVLLVPICPKKYNTNMYL